jgi:hypothetical protein
MAMNYSLHPPTCEDNYNGEASYIEEENRINYISMYKTIVLTVNNSVAASYKSRLRCLSEAEHWSGMVSNLKIQAVYTFCENEVDFRSQLCELQDWYHRNGRECAPGELCPKDMTFAKLGFYAQSAPALQFQAHILPFASLGSRHWCFKRTIEREVHVRYT